MSKNKITVLVKNLPYKQRDMIKYISAIYHSLRCKYSSRDEKKYIKDLEYLNHVYINDKKVELSSSNEESVKTELKKLIKDIVVGQLETSRMLICKSQTRQKISSSKTTKKKYLDSVKKNSEKTEGKSLDEINFYNDLLKLINESNEKHEEHFEDPMNKKRLKKRNVRLVKKPYFFPDDLIEQFDLICEKNHVRSANSKRQSLKDFLDAQVILNAEGQQRLRNEKSNDLARIGEEIIFKIPNHNEVRDLDVDVMKKMTSDLINFMYGEDYDVQALMLHRDENPDYAYAKKINDDKLMQQIKSEIESNNSGLGDHVHVFLSGMNKRTGVFDLKDRELRVIKSYAIKNNIKAEFLKREKWCELINDEGDENSEQTDELKEYGEVYQRFIYEYLNKRYNFYLKNKVFSEEKLKGLKNLEFAILEKTEDNMKDRAFYKVDNQQPKSKRKGSLVNVINERVNEETKLTSLKLESAKVKKTKENLMREITEASNSLNQIKIKSQEQQEAAISKGGRIINLANKEATRRIREAEKQSEDAAISMMTDFASLLMEWGIAVVQQSREKAIILTAHIVELFSSEENKKAAEQSIEAVTKRAETLLGKELDDEYNIMKVYKKSNKNK